MSSPAYRPIAGRTPYDINMENAQIERQRRADLRMQHPYDVGLAMSDPNWDSFFGGLHRAEETAHENGLNFRFSPAGLGNGMSFGEALNGGGERLNSNDRANIAGNLAIGDLVDRRHAVQNAEQAHADWRQGEIVNDLQQSYDQNALDSAAQSPLAPTIATKTAGVNGQPDKYTLRPDDKQPLSERDRILASVPGHVRLQLEPIFQKMDLADREQGVREGALEETSRHNQAMETGQNDDVSTAVSGMKDGTIPPQLPGRASKDYTKIMAEAKRQGYDLSGAVTDWNATQKHVATMNGAQQLRLNQSVNALPDMLDSVDALAKQWSAGRFPLLNRGNLMAAKAGALGKDAAVIANKLDAQIADVTADLGNVYMGGNSPTDHALGLAAKSLSADWDEKVLHSMVDLARNNVRIRQNSIRNTGVAGASANNPYAPPQAAAPNGPTPVAAPGGAPAAGGMIRARDPQGRLHQAPAGTPLPAGWKQE